MIPGEECADAETSYGIMSNVQIYYVYTSQYFDASDF